MTDQQPEPKGITDIPSQANSCLGIVGITGSGKTSLAITAIEEAWEVYKRTTFFYASDLGGYGNKLISLLKLGIARVWYIRNHVNPFETMELASQGYIPETIIDVATGFADPNVKLIPPRLIKWALICPNGHTAATFEDQAVLQGSQVKCPECGQLVTAVNALRVDKVITRPAAFKSIGHRVYDSMTQMCEYGMTELRAKSARGELPAGKEGGSALGSADALREGSMAFGTGSKAQYGFMQDRVPVWIANIRSIPDQVLPPVLTFGVEYSKGDDESGGMPMFGPKVSGNARTSSVPGWLGNCLYAAKEPHNPSELDPNGGVQLYHRLWLTTHVDPRDNRAVPIVAKHRGEPWGVPPFLEDVADPMKAWEKCSLREFYRLIREQAKVIEARDIAKYKDAPALQEADGTETIAAAEEVLSVASATETVDPAMVPSSTRIVRRGRRPQARTIAEAAGETSTPTEPAQDAASAIPTPTPEPAPIAQPAPVQAAAPAAAAPVTVTIPGIVAAPSPVVQQLQDSLAQQQAAVTATATTTPAPAMAVPPPPEPVASSAAPGPRTINRIRRIARPPA